MLLNIKQRHACQQDLLVAGVFGVRLLERLHSVSTEQDSCSVLLPPPTPSQSSFYHSIPAPPALLITRWYLPQNRLPSLACLCVNENDTMDLLYVSVSDK